MSQITRIGIDTSKAVFTVHCVDDAGKSAIVGGVATPCQRRTREGQRRRTQMADGFVVPLRPGNAGGGKEP
jgi:transposase